MSKMSHSLGWFLGIAIAGVSVSGHCVYAQIVPDGTLPNNSTVNVNGNIFDITGGTRAGSNLFHSFNEFSVLNGQQAHFNNAVDIQNIISRVTGSSVSNIDGLIKVLQGNANLFLLNPNGIIFGPNARLDIRGSFVASTASSLKFADGIEFKTDGTQTTPLLTVSVPIGLQYGGNTGSIRNQSQVTDSNNETVGLQVQPGKTLALVGGNVSLDGGILQAPGGRVELGGLVGAGVLGLSVDGNNLRLSFPTNVEKADVSLINGSGVDVIAGGGGSIVVNARNLSIAGESVLQAGIASGLGAINSRAGDIEIKAAGAINLTNSGYIINAVLEGGLGNAGDINITTESLSLTNGSQVNASTLGRGNAGNVRINARSTAFLFDQEDIDGFPSGAFSNVEKTGVGNGGEIKITTGSLFVKNGANLSASTFGRGYAGTVNITATDLVSFDGADRDGSPSKAISNIALGGEGKGGNVNITTKSLSVTNGAQLSTSTLGQGDAGSVTIHATDTVFFDGVGSSGGSSGIFNIVGTRAVGKGGSINIMTGSLSVNNGAQIDTFTRGQGDAGSVTINARTVSLNGISNGFPSAVASSVESKAVGNGGNIIITAGSLSLTNNALLLARTRGQGNAGSMMITASDTVFFDGEKTAASSSVLDGAVGNGGNIKITAKSLAVTNGGGLITSSNGSGVAGNIEVMAGSILLKNFATLSANSTAGQGNINLRSRDLILLGNSNITTNATGNQVIGGNINIDTNVLAAVENSDITANSANFRGGKVRINTQGIFRSPDSDITATGASPELSGTVQINRSDVDPSLGLVELPIVLADTSDLIAETSCAGIASTDADTEKSKFTITGRGGLPPNPYDSLSTDVVWSDTRTSAITTQQQAIKTPAAKPPSKAEVVEIVPATGWVFNGKGQVTLISHASNVNALRSTPSSCPKQ